MGSPESSAAANARAITVQQAAEEIGMSRDSVVRWVEAGLIPAFVPPGKVIGDGKGGPKGYRIFRRDWDEFLAANTVTAGVTPPAPGGTGPKVRPARVRSGPTGTDGKRRI